MHAAVYGFIGLGLIGGSAARSLKKQDPSCRIMAYTRTRSTLEAAREQGVIDLICESDHDAAFASCDILFLCAPVENNIKVLSSLKDVLSPRTLVTDVGSVKTGIREAARAAGLGGQFVGGHPMTGSEKSGFECGSDHLFENAYYILTPSEESDPALCERLHVLVRDVFHAIPLFLSCEKHDYITAAISHLPHVIASSLVNTVHCLDDEQEHMKLMAAGGFKDITRIASSSPEMWEQICLDNCENIASVMDTFIRLLTDARDQMKSGDGKGIYRMFEHSRDYRNSFSSVGAGILPKSWTIYCDIIDESGAIATIATLLAVSGISIKNIGIVHNREFEEGVLRIEFYEEASAIRSAAILRHHRYEVWEAR